MGLAARFAGARAMGRGVGVSAVGGIGAGFTVDAVRRVVAGRVVGFGGCDAEAAAKVRRGEAGHRLIVKA